MSSPPVKTLVGFFIFIGGVYVVWYIFSLQKVEFEYAVNGDVLDIAKIISLRKRKRVCRINIRDIERIEVGDSEIKNMAFRKVYLAAKNPNDTEINTYAVFTEPAYGKCMLVFNPNDTIMQAMKPYVNKDVLLKTYYKKK